MVALGLLGGSSFSEGFPTWAWGLAKLGASFLEGILPLYVALFERLFFGLNVAQLS